MTSKSNKAANAKLNKENKRLQKLNKQYLKDKKSLDEERRNFSIQTKDFSVSKRKLDTERKKFRNEQKKLKISTKAMKKQISRLETPKSGARGRTRSTGNFFEADYDDDDDGNTSPSGTTSSPWKSKYEKETASRRQLQREVNDLEFENKFLKKALKKSGGGRSRKPDKALLRKMKHMQKDLRRNKRQLRMAALDMERTCAYYRRQLASFKQKQTTWITDQRTLVKKNLVIKYIWADDIKKVKLRRRGRGGGIRVWFKDGDEAVFPDVDILLPENVIDVENAENSEDYDELLKEVRNDASLDNEDDDEEYMSSEDDEDDDDDGIDNIQSIVALLEELQARNKDLLAMQTISLQSSLVLYSFSILLFIFCVFEEYFVRKDGQSMNLRSEFINNLITKIKHRHETLNEEYKIVEEKKEDIKEDEIADEITIDKNIETLMKNNTEWCSNVQLFPLDLLNIMAYELDDRIRDLQHVRNIGEKYQSFEELMLAVKGRHSCMFDEWNEMEIEKWEEIVNEINNNNNRWREQIHKEPEPEVKEPDPERDISNSWLFQNPTRNQFIDSLACDSSDEQMICYIGRFLNRIIPTSDDLPIDLQHLYIPIEQDNDPNMSLAKHVIMSCLDGVLLATLINLVEPDFVDMRAMHIPDHNQAHPLKVEQIEENIATVLGSIKAMGLQLPHWTPDLYMDTNNTLNIIVTIVVQLFNAMMNSQMNLKSHPEMIRLCQNEQEKEDSSLWPAKEWMRRWLRFMRNPKMKHVRTKSRSSGDVNGSTNIDLGNYQKPEDLSSFAMLAVSEASELKNNNLKHPNEKKVTLVDNNSINSNNSNFSNGDDQKVYNADNVQLTLENTDYHEQILMVISKLDASFKIENKENDSNTDFIIAQQIIKSVKHKIRARTIVTIEDIALRNPLLQEMLLVDIFEYQNNIERISKTEKRRLTQLMKPPSKDDKSVLAWMNSLSGGGGGGGGSDSDGQTEDMKLHVHNLDRDMSDGIILLQLLAKCKKGCVNWKKQVRKKVRHKFDRLSNCNYAVAVCEQYFPFSLVGMAGSDIVDGNQKYIRTLLWQIMRYHSTRLLSELNFGGKNVTDADILQWSNRRLEMYHEILTNGHPQLYQELNSKKVLKSRIRSLKDPTLSDSIFYINTLASIHQKWINYELVYYIPELPTKREDKYQKQRIANARYCMTIIRRLGGELFVMAEDLCAVEPRAVLSVIASIMTIAAKHTADDELILERQKSIEANSIKADGVDLDVVMSAYL